MAATTKQTAAMTGVKKRLVIFMDDQKIMVDFESSSVKPNVTKHEDHINGAQRAELDQTLNFYELTGMLFMRRGDIIRAWLAYQKVRDANTAPLDMEGAIRFYPNDGTRESFVLVGLVWDEFEVQDGARNQKMKVPVSMRFEDLVEAKTLGPTAAG